MMIRLWGTNPDGSTQQTQTSLNGIKSQKPAKDAILTFAIAPTGATSAD
jgi:hypothetical protein